MVKSKSTPTRLSPNQPTQEDENYARRWSDTLAGEPSNNLVAEGSPHVSASCVEEVGEQKYLRGDDVPKIVDESDTEVSEDNGFEGSSSDTEIAEHTPLNGDWVYEGDRDLPNKIAPRSFDLDEHSYGPTTLEI